MSRAERRSEREAKRWEYRPLRWLTRSLEWKVSGESGALRVYGPGQARTLAVRMEATGEAEKIATSLVWVTKPGEPEVLTVA